MKKTLIVYPHGLGDCIAGTPAFRKYKLTNGDKVHISVLKDNAKVYAGESSTPCKALLEGLTYIDKVHPIHSHLWAHDKANWDVMEEEAQALHKDIKFDKIFFIKHKRTGGVDESSIHKMFRTAGELGMSLNPNEIETDVWISPNDFKRAQTWFNKRDINPERSTCMFTHGKTNSSPKDLSGDDIMDMWNWKTDPPEFVIECDSPEPYFQDSIKLNLKNPIRVNLAIMMYCKHALLVDSVFMHARGAYSLPMVAGFTAKHPVFQAIPIHYSDFKVFVTDDGCRRDYMKALTSFMTWRASHEDNKRRE